MTIEEIMNLARQMIDPRNTQAPILGGIRQFNQQTFGTPWYLNPDLSSEEKMMNMAMSFGPASISKVKPAVEIVANPVMKKALEMSRKIGTERIPTIDETSDIIKMAKEQLKLPKNVFNRMSPRELLDELTSLATRNQKYAYQELPQATKGVGIPKELEPLAQEARKYKSAEEFVKNSKEFMTKEADLISIDRFSGKNADIVPNQVTVSKSSIDFWKRKIQQGERPKVVVGYLDFRKSNTVLDGHSRLRAYKDLGIKDIPVEIQEKLKPTKSQLTDFYTQATEGVYGR